jgi:hypothetical protein
MNEYQSLWSAVYQQYPDILFAMIVSMISGAVSHFRRFHAQRPRLFSLYEFMADVLSSGVLGFIIIMAAAHIAVTGALKLSPFIIGAVIPIAGWSAPKLLDLANRKLINHVKVEFDHDPP